jgi:hypothetical protein
MLVRRFRAFEALAVLTEALADNVERLTTFIRISSAGSMRGSAAVSGLGGDRRNFPGCNGQQRIDLGRRLLDATTQALCSTAQRHYRTVARSICEWYREIFLCDAVREWPTAPPSSVLVQRVRRPRLRSCCGHPVLTCPGRHHDAEASSVARHLRRGSAGTPCRMKTFRLANLRLSDVVTSNANAAGRR